MNFKFDDFIYVCEGAFTEEYCDSLIENFELLDRNGFTFTRRQVDGTPKTLKDDTSISTINSAIPGSKQEADIVSFLENISSDFNTVLDYHVNHYINQYDTLREIVWYSDAIKVQRTERGGGYHQWHFESSNRAVRGRVLTFVLYLNDVEEGGETEFLYQGKRQKPKKGTLVIFPAEFTHTHRGNPPLKGRKYIATGWINAG